MNELYTKRTDQSVDTPERVKMYLELEIERKGESDEETKRNNEETLTTYMRIPKSG